MGMYIGHIARVWAKRRFAGGRGRLRPGGHDGRLGGGVDFAWGASPLMEQSRMGEGEAGGGRTHPCGRGFCMLLAFSLAMMALVIPLREPMLRLLRRERRDLCHGRLFHRVSDGHGLFLRCTGGGAEPGIDGHRAGLRRAERAAPGGARRGAEHRMATRRSSSRQNTAGFAGRRWRRCSPKWRARRAR
ncbi:MAG: hypothetical protein ACLUHE_18060 [Christensenellales bacterium]